MLNANFQYDVGYTTEDITNRDYELRAKAENDINLCYEITEEPLIIICPEVATIISTPFLSLFA